MKGFKQEKRLLRLIYVLCLLLFVDLAFQQKPFDTLAIIMGVVLCIVIGYSHFVIRRYYPDGDKFILNFASVLAVVSIATLYRINSGTALKQLVWVVLGIVGYILVVAIIPELSKFTKYKKIYMIATLILMPSAYIYAKITGAAPIGGAYNWISIGNIMLQPSEFGKITLVLYLAAAFAEYEDNGSIKDDIKQLIVPALVAGVSLIFLVAQADLGSALIFFGIIISLLYVATSKKLYVFLSLGGASAGAILAYNLFAHIRERVMIWRNPWDYASDAGYQLVQSLYAISSGGLFGSGLGQGFVEYIPVNDSDFIYAVICEEFGIIFAVGLMIIYFLLFFRGIRSAYVTNDKFSQLAVVGFSTMIACQTLVIIGGIFGVIPLTGITLPILSYGGSSVLTIFFALAILQKVSEEA